ncbi:UNVERIFIED_CONTAM: hypothetical protein FKN15_076710 [Acipenser sinensis]
MLPPRSTTSVVGGNRKAGMIRTEKEEFFIEPVELGGELGKEEQGGRQHIVYRKSSIKTSPSNQTSDFHGKALPLPANKNFEMYLEPGQDSVLPN